MANLNMVCAKAVEELCSIDSIPGSTAASALVGAVGASLGYRAAKAGIRKAENADRKAEYLHIVHETEKLEKSLIDKLDGDVMTYELFLRARNIPDNDPERDGYIETLLEMACTVPMSVMRDCCKVIEQHEELLKSKSIVLKRNVGAGVLYLKAALMSASINVFSHTKMMADREYAAQLEAEANDLLSKYCEIADNIYASVISGLELRIQI